MCLIERHYVKALIQQKNTKYGFFISSRQQFPRGRGDAPRYAHSPNVGWMSSTESPGSSSKLSNMVFPMFPLFPVCRCSITVENVVYYRNGDQSNDVTLNRSSCLVRSGIAYCAFVKSLSSEQIRRRAWSGRSVTIA